MATRRMFSKDIVSSDEFISLPLSAQALYFHLGMNADDDGILSNAKSVMLVIGAKDDDIKLLLAKRFLLLFNEKYLVVKHRKINNQMRKDRYVKTKYNEIKEQLYVEKNNSYTEDKSKGIPLIGNEFQSVD